MMRDDARLQQIHDFTSNFFFWQGLRWVPLGAAMVVMSLQPGRRLPFGRFNELAAGLLIVAIAGLLSRSVGRWYRRTFGAVRGEPEMHRRRDLLKKTVFYPILFLALYVDGEWGLPVLVSGFAWAASLIAYRKSTGGGRNHYLVLAGVFLMAAFVPLIAGPGGAIQRLNFLLALMGITYIVAGVLDHFALVGMMKSPEVDDARTV